MKKNVFITGVTGMMGFETLKKLLENGDEFHIRALARDTEENRTKLAPYENEIDILWGDLKDPAILRKGVKDADYVLAIGAFVSPKCDAFPEETMRVNLGSTLSMLKSIHELGQTETTHYVNIGSVAMIGDRLPPVHWSRIGDPLKPSIYDYYAVSKVFAERAVIESGLKYWVCIRQTGMMPADPSGGEYPVVSHSPYNNLIEWSNSVDSGNLMRNICKNAPEEFWRHCYNLSNGKEYRQSTASGAMLQGRDIRATSEPNWRAIHNFHGAYYLDADDLEEMVPFRTMSYQEALKYQAEYYTKYFTEKMQAAAAAAIAAGKPFVPPAPPTVEEQKENNRRVWSQKGGILQIVRDHDEEGIKVWFGSQEKYDAIPETWEEALITMPVDMPAKPLSRGFDETKPIGELNIEDMKQAAAFRGGECLSETMVPGGLYTDLRWRCAQGHEFTANPYAVLFAGHWCEHCMSKEWRYGDMAEENPFFAQVWKPLHHGEENFSVKMIIDPREIAKEYA